MLTRRRDTTTAQMMNFSVGDSDMLRALAFETGARAIVDRNDIRGELQRITRDASAYYLIAYESPHPDDGKFHCVTVRATRPRTTVFARAGYWSFKRGQNADGPASLAPVVPAAMNEAVNRLADSQRPNADEPIEAPSRVHMPPPAPPPPPARPPDDGVRARGLTVVQTRPERRWPGVARARRSGRRERGGESPSDSLRPNADEPIEAPRRVHMPPPASPPPPARLPLLAAPSVSVAQGRLLSAPVNRREFRRSDVVVVRASVTGSPDISARLLNQVGQPWRTCRLPSATARAR